MKYFTLLALFLGGCSSAPRFEPKGIEYTCTAYNLHGSYAKYKITATNCDLATKIAQDINDRIVARSILPESAVDCSCLSNTH